MSYQIDPRLDRDIGRAEGDDLTAYKDSEGYWTIGTGHLLQPQDHDWTGYTITPEEDAKLRDSDIMIAAAFAQRLPEWAACDTDCRRNALIELCFNMRGRWLGFHNARYDWRNQQWGDAAKEMLNSKWAGEVKGRAVRLANYVRTGQYPI